MKIIPAQLSNRDCHELFMSAILPRPIAFVSTVGEDGVFNLAPYSSFALLGLKPALVCFFVGLKRDGQKKDTTRNIELLHDFVVNVVTEDLAEAMNQTAAEYPAEVDEFKEAGLTAISSELVKAPRVAESPVTMECRLVQIIPNGEVPTGGHVIIGEVLLVHVADELWAGDQVDVAKLRPIGRLGGDLYCRTTDVFEMKRPPTPSID
jgi:flavin reductase (DIM6/NTAB) family NADH-FMN oxidoreductase RutF